MVLRSFESAFLFRFQCDVLITAFPGQAHSSMVLDILSANFKMFILEPRWNIHFEPISREEYSRECVVPLSTLKQVDLGVWRSDLQMSSKHCVLFPQTYIASKQPNYLLTFNVPSVFVKDKVPAPSDCISRNCDVFVTTVYPITISKLPNCQRLMQTQLHFLSHILRIIFEIMTYCRTCCLFEMMNAGKFMFSSMTLTGYQPTSWLKVQRRSSLVLELRQLKATMNPTENEAETSSYSLLFKQSFDFTWFGSYSSLSKMSDPQQKAAMDLFPLDKSKDECGNHFTTKRFLCPELLYYFKYGGW